MSQNDHEQIKSKGKTKNVRKGLIELAGDIEIKVLDSQRICEVMEPRGGSSFLVRYPSSQVPEFMNLDEISEKEPSEVLVTLPHKFHNLIFITKGSYVIIDIPDSYIPHTKKIRGNIVRPLTKENIKYLYENDQWPTEFPVEELDHSLSQNVEPFDIESGFDPMQSLPPTHYLKLDDSDDDTDSDSD